MAKEEKLKQKYRIFGSDSLYYIRNRNEKRVVQHLPEILEEYGVRDPDLVDVQDIYALALNKLPARYVQEFTVVLNEPVTDEKIKQAIREAVERVRENPKGGA